MFINFENFIYSSNENFPKADCTIKDEENANVFLSNALFLVMYIDIRFSNEKCITYAKPYIYKDTDGSISYGWEAIYSSELFGNVENSCQFHNEFVVGFIKVDEEYIRTDNELFDTYKQTIKSYQE